MQHSILITGLLGAAVLAGSASAAFADIDSVTPAEGTVGTEIVIAGNGFGTGRARVMLVAEAVRGRRPVRARVRVTSVTDTEIRAVVLRAGEATFDVVVRTRSRAVFQSDGAFEAVAPQMDAFDLDPVGLGDEVTLAGQYLGARRGRVRVGGRPARVTAWSDGSCTFRVPRVANGFHEVTVTSRAGTTVLDDNLVVTGSPVGTFARDCSCFRIGRRTVMWQAEQAALADGVLTVSGTWGPNTAVIEFPCDPRRQEYPCTLQGPDGAAMTVRLIKPPRGAPRGTFRAFGWTGTVNVMIGGVDDDGRIHGTYSATLLMAQTNERLEITEGRFSFTPPAE